MDEPINKDHIKSLCKCVEEKLGMKVSTPKHFERLAVMMFERTGILLSPTTLKRIWGYLHESTSPRRSTLDVMARSCGWHSYDDFVAGNVPEIESGFVWSRVINVESDLNRGDIITLTWSPSRVCVIKYLGYCNWIVVRSEGTRLVSDDTFRCPMIVAGEPLYLDNVQHKGSPSGVYVCGRRHGIGFILGEIQR